MNVIVHLTQNMLGYSDYDQFTCCVYSSLSYNHVHMVCIFIALVAYDLSNKEQIAPNCSIGFIHGMKLIL
jgi:hypothetical protein